MPARVAWLHVGVVVVVVQVHTDGVQLVMVVAAGREQAVGM